MKRIVKGILAAILLLLPALALAEGPVLLIELPEDARMIENVEFENGDFIQTYQLDGGVTAQLLRYAAFDMNLEDLIEGEWTEAVSVQALEIAEIAGYPAQGAHLLHQEANTMYDVYMLLVEADGQTLLFEAVFPNAMGSEAVSAQMNGWLESMTVSGGESDEVG